MARELKPITLTTALPDSNKDGVVVVSAQGAVKYGIPYAGTWLGPQKGEPNFTYYPEGYVKPAAPVAPSVPLTAMQTGPSRNINFGKQMVGINVSGGEFMVNGALIPKVRSIREYLAKGFTLLRVPFNSKQLKSPASMAKLVAIAEEVSQHQGCYVMYDRHEFAAPFCPAHVPFWIEFMSHFPAKLHGCMVLDTMNEPKGGRGYQPDAAGLSYATDINEGIRLLRDADVSVMLVHEWKGYSGMSRFDKNERPGRDAEGPATSFDLAGGLVDPLGLTMMSGHGYPDKDSSGTSPYCDGAKKTGNWINNAIGGCRKRGIGLIIGEMAFGNYSTLSETCEAVARGTIARIKESSDVVLGVTWWGGGESWKEGYHYKAEPTKGTFATAPNGKYLDLLLMR